MAYDYGRSVISKATGLTGVQAGHIANKLREMNVDPQTIDWEGAISDAADYGDRYAAVQRYIFSYYGIDVMTNVSAGVPPMFTQQGLEDMTSTKKGVKDALKSYYNSATKQEKAAIKDMLLNDNQMQMVLLTALYDGTEMPLAKKFLNEAMGGSAIAMQPVKQQLPVQPMPVKQNGNGGNGRKQEMLDQMYESLFQPQPETTPVPVRKKTWSEQLGETQTAKSIAKALPGIEKTLERNLKAISAQLKSSVAPSKGERISGLKGQIQQLRSQNEPLRLQLEYQRLLYQRQQLQQLKQMTSMRAGPRPMDLMLAHMIGIPTQQQQRPVMRSALDRPGYYVEYRPKLPAGFRWKKAPTGRKPKKRKR